MRALLLATALCAGITSTAALAGPVADYENSFRQAYGDYRAALFQTNAGKQDQSEAALAKLEAGLGALLETYRDAPPPHLADDPAWGETLDAVAALVVAARAEIDEGELAVAHETLERVRDLFRDLHRRNGIETFSDRMNAYHEEMEHVLAMDLARLDADRVGEIRERAAVLSYLAQDVLRAPPPDGAGNAEFDTLARSFGTSVSELLESARSGDPDRIRGAVSGLKKPYAMLFLKFG